MELDRNTLLGEWTTDYSISDSEYFNVNSATFSALCILGEGVEPCFESSSVTGYSLNKNQFMTDFNFMVKELKYSLEKESKIKIEDEKTKISEGGKKMANIFKLNITEDGIDFKLYSLLNKKAEEVEYAELKYAIKSVDEENCSANVYSFEDGELYNVKFTKTEAGEILLGDFSKVEKEIEVPEDYASIKEKIGEYELVITELTEVKSNFETTNTEFGALKEINEALEMDFTATKEKLEVNVEYNEFKESVKDYSEIKENYTNLEKFKDAKDKEAKELMISKFSILDESDLKPFVDNMDKYTVVEIEKELSVIAFRKKINFSLDNDNEEEKASNLYSAIGGNENESVPAWVKRVEEVRKANK
jgi:hypothetical protein